MSISKQEKENLIKEHGLFNGDTGSVEVQSAILTHRINNLTEHGKSNKKDFSSRRGLLILVSRRRRLLDFLKGKDEQRYKHLISKLGLRK